MNHHKCTDASTQKLYNNVCHMHGSSQPIKQCVNNLTNVCKTVIKTEKDFNLQLGLFECYVKNHCNKGDEACMNACVDILGKPHAQPPK